MKLFVILVAFLLAGLSLADEIPPGGECTPGSRWKKECNWCSCTTDGMGAFCTLRGCPQDYQPDPRQQQCEEGSKWKVACNTCVCVDGQPRCTEKGCIQVQQNVRDDADIPPGATCKPGSSWMQECNWCSCGEDGLMTRCTLMACVPGYQPSPDMKQCETGSKWMENCNICTCVDERIRCTKRACIDRPVPQNPGLPDIQRSGEKEETCTEGSRWREDCNWCTCSNGVGICTLRACEGGVAQTDVPECEGNSRWKKDCNWCNCVNGRGICTAMACNVSPQIPSTSVQVTVSREEAECTEHSRWRKECNWCRCANGRGVCTKRACFSEADENSDPECAGDSRWKKDCNWCYCANGIGICTTRACNISPQIHSDSSQVTVSREEAQCTEGSRWRQDCNWCRCVEGRGACTKRGCIPGRVVEGPECEGNSSWTKDCNRCNCFDGRAVCTLRACVGEVPHQRSDPEPCEEGATWAEDCNRCSCRNGVPTCTKRLCRSPSVAVTPGQSAPAEQCEEGATWAEDCNRCSCRNGVPTCTKRLCRGPSVDLTTRQTEPTTCIKGTSWRQDCNRCTCENEVPTCTKRLCPDPPATPTNERENPRPCINGTSWTQDCNRCVCNNGVSQCTRRLCPDPPVHPICHDPAHHPDVERCRGFEVLWTFDSAAGKCVEVVYGGCGGTGNLFKSKTACEERCVRTGHVQGASRSLFRARQPERCTYKFEQGPCFAKFYRYGYNTDTGRCEQFLYGGCQGNGNNFETAAECQQVCGGGPPVSDPECDRSQCPWKRWGNYIAKNCLPQYEEGSCCPTSFSCPQADELIPDPTKCYYKGAVYDLGDNVPVDEKCSASCRCASGPNMSEIRCANIECPELFRRLSPDCRLLYKPDTCCSYDTECGVPPELEPRSTACTWNNKTYRQGDKMYFDDFPCQYCVCTPEFTSPTGPGCSKIDCGFEFRYTSRLADGCVPIFFEQKCCPIGWMCPGDSRLEPSASDNQQQRVSTETAQCHLGELSVPVGAKVPTTDCKIDCRCSTPPELTCVQYRSCEAAEENQPKDCPEIKCSPACRTVTDSVTGCSKCSCSENIFTCEKKECPAGCGKDVDPKTGCPSCQCQCPKDPSGRPPCPADCATRFVTDEETGCEICECDPTKPVYILGRPQCPAYPQGRPPCPQDCATRTVADERTGCMKCECDPENPGNPFAPPQRSECPRDHTGSPPCPMDCAIRYIVDEETGCQKCECDPNNPGHPFGPPPRLDCPKDPNGRPPCPMDCAVRIVLDPETGCEKCECDPNNPGHPFGPPPPPPRANCPVGPSGLPPCPMDCAIRYVTDEETGCQKCECDPNNPGHPFGPPPPRANCPVGPSGRPPCPMDCPIRFVTDPATGCRRCECDPNVPVHPFHPLIRPTQQRSDCRTDHTGRAPCPMDCAVRFVTDPATGCERCECDPNNPGNPFNPF